MSRRRETLLRDANAALLVEGDLAAAERCFAPDYVAHLTRKQLVGPAAVRRFVRRLRAAFTDLSVEVEVLVASKDRVAWQRTLRGRHTGAYAGFPPTGRRVVWRDVITTRFADGRVAEEWSISDLAEQLLRARS